MALVVMVEELRQRLEVLEQENEKLRLLSNQDGLTGLLNRRGFESELNRALDLVARYGGQISLVAIDLDGMKPLNDTHGHPAGDAALQQVANTMRATLRASDLAARVGGDEFALILPETSYEGAAHVSERIRRSISRLELPGGRKLTTSIGLANALQTDHLAAGELYARADAALYRAKRNGRNRIETEDSPKLSSSDLERLTLCPTMDLWSCAEIAA
jgi:diguanylate cyclase (GGDEF)-like protein